jgi:predicted ferric reductase
VALVVIAAGAVGVIGLWWANTPGGSLHTFADRLTAAGRITGLLGTYLILVQVVLMARLPWLDRSVGTDRMAGWHRSNCQYTIVLLVAYTFLVIWGYAGFDHRSLTRETAKLVRSYPDVLAATVDSGYW